jgi:hypothetical protein
MFMGALLGSSICQLVSTLQTSDGSNQVSSANLHVALVVVRSSIHQWGLHNAWSGMGILLLGNVKDHRT